jgi:hypothetical protein
MNPHEHVFEGHRWNHRHASDRPHDHPVKSERGDGEPDILTLDTPPEVDERGMPVVTFLRVNW